MALKNKNVKFSPILKHELLLIHSVIKSIRNI